MNRSRHIPTRRRLQQAHRPDLGQLAQLRHGASASARRRAVAARRRRRRERVLRRRVAVVRRVLRLRVILGVRIGVLRVRVRRRIRGVIESRGWTVCLRIGRTRGMGMLGMKTAVPVRGRGMRVHGSGGVIRRGRRVHRGIVRWRMAEGVRRVGVGRRAMLRLCWRASVLCRRTVCVRPPRLRVDLGMGRASVWMARMALRMSARASGMPMRRLRVGQMGLAVRMRIAWMSLRMSARTSGASGMSMCRLRMRRMELAAGGRVARMSLRMSTWTCGMPVRGLRMRRM